MTVSILPESVQERFWEKVRVAEEDDCWEWLAGKSRGYGQLSSKKRQSPYKAHRLSWILHHGEIPEGMHVCHKCDNPSCVNPNHLFLGTHIDNMRDMARKGRAHKTGLRSEDNPKALLTWDAVAVIRKLYASKKFPQAELGKRFGVDRTTVGYIVRNKHWHDPNYAPDPSASGATLSKPRPYRRMLSDQDVEEILRLRESTILSMKEIGARFSVSKTTIGKVVRGTYYKRR